MSYQSPIGSGFQLPTLQSNSFGGQQSSTPVASTPSVGSVLGPAASQVLPQAGQTIGTTLGDIGTLVGAGFKGLGQGLGFSGNQSGSYINSFQNNTSTPSYFMPSTLPGASPTTGTQTATHPIVAAAAVGAQAAVNALQNLPGGGQTTAQGGYAGNPATNPYLNQNQSTSPSSVVPQNVGYGTGSTVGASSSNSSLPSQYQNGGSVSQVSPTQAQGGSFDYSAASNGQPYTGYNVNVPDTTNSETLGAGLSYTDALNARNSLMQDYLNKSNAYANYYGQNMSQQMKDQYSGDTTDYGTGAASLYKAESAPQLLSMQMQAGNALTALQAQQQQAQNLNPFQNQVAPGSTAYDPSTGMAVTAGMGASPAQIVSTAQGFAQMAISNGSAQYNSDGSINMTPYYQMAQQAYAPGGSLSSSPAGTVPQQTSATGSNAPIATSGLGGSTPLQTGLSANNGTPDATTMISQLPPQVQPYAQTVTLNNNGQQFNLPFIDQSRIPPGMVGVAQAAASKAGIPFVSDQGATAIMAAEQIMNVADGAIALSNATLSPGVGGRVLDATKNWLNNIFQFNPTLSQFSQLQDTAGKAVTALQGGIGSGMRINNTTLEAAVMNLPSATDNLETAVQSANSLKSLVMNAIAPLYPGLGNQVNLMQGYGDSSSSSSAPASTDSSIYNF